MRKNGNYYRIRKLRKKSKSSNVKLLKKYHNFGEIIWYLTIMGSNIIYSFTKLRHYKFLLKSIKKVDMAILTGKMGGKMDIITGNRLECIDLR